MVISCKPSNPAITLASAVAILAALAPAAGWSLTAEEVWSRMQEIVAESGQTVRVASEQSSPGILKLNGVTISSETEAGVDTATLIDGLTFASQDDGTVRISKTGRYQFVIDFGDGFNIERTEFELIETDVEMEASGTAQDMTLTYAAGTVEVSIVDMHATDPSVARDASVTVTGIHSETSYRHDQIIANGRAETMKSDFLIKNQNNNDNGELTWQISDLAFSFTASNVDLEKIAAVIKPFNSVVSYGAFSLGAAIASPGANGTLAMSGGSGEIRSAAKDELLSIDVKTSELDFDLRALGMPGPISWTAEQFGFQTSGPVVWSFDGMGVNTSGQPTPPLEGEFPFTLGLLLEDVNLGAETWNIFDPNGFLPRDPAQMVLNLDGTVEVNDRVAPGETVSTPTLEPNAVTIDMLNLGLAGATLDAEGALDMFYDQPGARPGMPGLVGKVFLTVSGMDGLLQGLTEIGIMDSQGLVGAQMMLGMLARPGEIPGTLESEIEFTPGGGVVANGMPMR